MLSVAEGYSVTNFGFRIQINREQARYSGHPMQCPLNNQSDLYTALPTVYADGRTNHASEEGPERY